MPRQTILTRPTGAGTEWPSAVVDAPDAYYSDVKVRLIGCNVTVMAMDYTPMGAYVLDADPDEIEPGIVIGTVDMVPLVIRHEHFCDCGRPSRRVPKGEQA